MKKSDRVILCDLGGVLIDLNWISHASELFGKATSAEALKSRWLELQSVKLIESGKIAFAEFYRQFCHETGSCIGFEVFTREFIGILGPDKPDCAEILTRLAKVGQLAMLSNTNALHIETLKKTSSVFAAFDKLFLSYEMGMVKPDTRIFLKVCEQLGSQAANVYFFDDSEVNIAAARAVGMNAWRVDSPQEIEKIVGAW